MPVLIQLLHQKKIRLLLQVFPRVRNESDWRLYPFVYELYPMLSVQLESWGDEGNALDDLLDLWRAMNLQ
jgi:hypothetical protein